MKPLIVNPIYTEPVLGMNAEQLQNVFKLYGSTQHLISEESLGKFASNIAVSFGDFVFRVGNNIKANVGGLFKEFKRSTLKIAIDSNKVSFNNIFKMDYSTLCQYNHAQYPFIPLPKDVMKFIDGYIVLFDMSKRIETIIHECMMFASYIDVNDMSSAEAVIKRLESMNFKKYLEVTYYFQRNIAQANERSTPFGKVFNSVTEFKEAIDNTLIHADELEKAVKIGVMLDKLYDAFARIQKSILRAKDKNIDFNRIINISMVINDIGILIEQYAMLVKEYHHLEFWLAKVIEDIVQNKK